MGEGSGRGRTLGVLPLGRGQEKNGVIDISHVKSRVPYILDRNYFKC